MTQVAPAVEAEDPGAQMVRALIGRWMRRPQDRALLARLRRGVGRRFGEDGDAAAALFEVLPAPATKPYRDELVEDAFLVATLFAVHPSAARSRRSLGETLRLTSRESTSPAAERQLGMLLVADREDLSWHLRRAVTFARSHDVAIDFHTLMRDVRAWSHPDRYAQRRWARDFYNAPSTTADSTRQENDR